MKKKKILSRIGYGVLIGIIFLFSVMIVFNLTHIYYNVLGPSMCPTLNEGVTSQNENKDGVFVSKIKSCRRGDIVVIDKQQRDIDGNEEYIIKRLIALGGDKITVRLEDGFYRIILIKNGEENETILEEPYLPDYSVNESTYIKFNNMIEENDELYLDINGFLTIPEDEMFYLGDNRTNSYDCANYGPVKRNTIVGRVDYIVYGNSFMYLQVLKQFFGW